MDILTQWHVDPGDARLLSTGLPVGSGMLRPADLLSVEPCGTQEPCPLWWEPRAFWPDGSVRWIYLQTVTVAGIDNYRLVRGNDKARMNPQRVEHPSHPLVLPVQDGFEIRLDGRKLASVRQEISCSLAVSEAPFQSVLLENSPIAPLYRIENLQDGHTGTTFLVRIDLASGTLHLTCRFSLHGEGTYALSAAHIHLDACFEEEQPKECPSEASKHDLVLHSGNSVLTLVDGRRRGPARLSLQEGVTGSFGLHFFESDGIPMAVSGGTSFRQQCRVCPGHDRKPVQMTFQDGYIAGTGVFGPVADMKAERVNNLAPGMVVGLKRLFDLGSALSVQEDPAWRGISHDGDWLLDPEQYGASGYRAYADNEYDAAYAYYLAYAAFNDSGYLRVAARCSVHMADVDCLCTTGDMRYHGYGPAADDHGAHRVRQGDPGHYWTDGLWLAYFWLDDVFALESAIRLTRLVISRFDEKALADEFAICERNIGWPLLVAVSHLEAGIGGNGQSLAFCRRVLLFLDAYAADPDSFYMDPDGPVWWRCAFQDGCKPFMLGVLGEALERICQLTGDAAAARILHEISSFILGRLFDPVRLDFEYECNAYGPGHRFIPAQQLIPLFIRSLLFSSMLDKREDDGHKALAALHACTWCLFDARNGKDIALMARGLLPALALADRIGQAESRRYRDGLPASRGVSCRDWSSATPDAPQVVADGYHSDAASIRIRYYPEAAAQDGLNRQAFFHACDTPPNRSAVSIIAFYNRIQARFYDQDRHLVDSLDAFVSPSFFQPGSCHQIRVAYQAPGQAELHIDGQPAAQTSLDRPLSGAFRHLFTGCKPGNWKVNGSVAIQASFGTDFTGEQPDWSADAFEQAGNPT
jgi:hypothetical protein